MASRTCPKSGCGRTIPSDQFACRSHWFSIPPDIRRDIWGAYREWERGSGTIEQLEAQQRRALEQWGQA